MPDFNLQYRPKNIESPENLGFHGDVNPRLTLLVLFPYAPRASCLPQLAHQGKGNENS